MNWGHRFKEHFTRNWREKVISLVLAFLFWFMIKAQDERYVQPYAMPQPVKIAPPTTPAPSLLTPTLPPSPAVPSKLKPTLPLPPGPNTGTVIDPPAGIGTGLPGFDTPEVLR